MLRTSINNDISIINLDLIFFHIFFTSFVLWDLKIVSSFRDVIVDLICYQKYVAPEKNIPKYIMNKINKQRPILEKYSEKLVKEEVKYYSKSNYNLFKL